MSAGAGSVKVPARFSVAPSSTVASDPPSAVGATLWTATVVEAWPIAPSSSVMLRRAMFRVSGPSRLTALKVGLTPAGSTW